jgi:hypothetical protein
VENDGAGTEDHAQVDVCQPDRDGSLPRWRWKMHGEWIGQSGQPALQDYWNVGSDVARDEPSKIWVRKKSFMFTLTPMLLLIKITSSQGGPRMLMWLTVSELQYHMSNSSAHS